ncbi:hypothetical protein ACT6QG_15915 [Xanthobacter sp. TB0136]
MPPAFPVNGPAQWPGPAHREFDLPAFPCAILDESGQKRFFPGKGKNLAGCAIFFLPTCPARCCIARGFDQPFSARPVSHDEIVGSAMVHRSNGATPCPPTRHRMVFQYMKNLGKCGRAAPFQHSAEKNVISCLSFELEPQRRLGFPFIGGI